MRIFFIHGFGEKPDIFSNIAPAIGGEQVFIDVWHELENEKQEGLNVAVFAKKLADQYKVNNTDWIIGHSMGGWIAYYMKYYCGCHIVQLSSFTDFKKVVTPVHSRKLVYRLVDKGLFFNPFMKWLFTTPYRKLPSCEVHTANFSRLAAGERKAAIKQLMLIFEPAPAIAVLPNLRIHAVKDAIVKPPDEQFYEVPGDHYALVTHAAAVIKPILKLLETQAATI